MQINNINIPENEKNSLEYLRKWISKYTGIYYSEDKKEILYSRLVQLCLKNNFLDLNDVVNKLNSDLFDSISLTIAQAVSTTHTYFYREVEVLNYFSEKIIDKNDVNEKIRLWSAASSSGQEVYTIAILLAEK
ncbi:MAG: CheR family methyltransferase, partial [Candidatus Sericytochromatia bacterium]